MGIAALLALLAFGLTLLTTLRLALITALALALRLAAFSHTWPWRGQRRSQSNGERELARRQQAVRDWNGTTKIKVASALIVLTAAGLEVASMLLTLAVGEGAGLEVAPSKLHIWLILGVVAAFATPLLLPVVTLPLMLIALSFVMALIMLSMQWLLRAARQL